MKLLILLLFALPAACADMEGWFAAEGPILSWSRSELNFHAQLRVRDTAQGVAYGRAGAISRTSLYSHLNLIAGYYYEERHFEAVDWSPSHRIFGGGELPFRRGRWQTQGRVLLEQFLGVDGGAYKRVRERIEIGRTGPLNPYGSYEWVHDANGIQFTRARGGVSFRAMPRATLDFSYSYDNRDVRFGGSRQFILTTLEWERRP
jgi:hypothetical protein